MSPRQIPAHVLSMTDSCECTVRSSGNGLNLISAAEERREEETGRDGCVDREDWRDEFKIWLDVMSGDREE